MDTLEDIKRLIALDYQRKTMKWSKETNTCDVLLAGDSMVSYFKTQLNISLQGIAGDTTKGLLNRIQLIKKTQASHVFIHIGTNDIVLEDMTIDQTMDHLKQIIDILKPAKSIIITPLPVVESQISALNKNRTNRHLKSLTHRIVNAFPNQHMNIFDDMINRHNMAYFYQDDGLHLNEHGYAIYESYIKTILEELI